MREREQEKRGREREIDFKKFVHDCRRLINVRSVGQQAEVDNTVLIQKFFFRKPVFALKVFN